MPLRNKDEIPNYKKKAKVLRKNGWTDLWHTDNWVKEEWFGHPTIDVDRAGCSMNAAYAGLEEGDPLNKELIKDMDKGIWYNIIEVGKTLKKNIRNVMKNKSEVNLIGKIDFLDVEVKVYHDPYSSDRWTGCTWSARNPDSFYQEICYMPYNVKITYPDDAIIPAQTEEDREILPRFIITNEKEITEEFLSVTETYLATEHKRRNGKS